MMSEEFVFRVEFKDHKGKELKESATSATPNGAVRKLFPTAGEVKLKPAETIVYNFEATEERTGKVITGIVYRARQTKT